MKRLFATFMAIIFTIALLPSVEVKASNLVQKTEEKSTEEKIQETHEIIDNQIKITVMNYHNKGEVAKSSQISVGDKIYNSNNNGEVFIPVSEMSDDKGIVVSYANYEKGEYLLYKTPTNVYKEDTVITIDKEEVVDKKIKQASDTAKLDLESVRVKIDSSKKEFPGRDMELGYKGTGTLTTNIEDLEFSVYPYSRWGTELFLNKVTSTKLDEDVIIDNVKVGRLIYNDGLCVLVSISNNQETFKSETRFCSSIYVAEGTYNYSFRYETDKQYMQSGEFKIEANKDTLFEYDINFKSNLEVISNPNLNSYEDEIEIKAWQTDGYGHKLSIRSEQYIEYYVDGKIVKTERVYFGQSEVTRKIKPNITYPKYSIVLVQKPMGEDLGGATRSEPYEINVNMNNYRSLDVKVPNGDIVKSGTIGISFKEGSNDKYKTIEIRDGKVDINKTYKDIIVKCLNGITEKGEKVYTGNFLAISKNDTVVLDKDLKLYDITVNKDSFGSDLYNSNIEIDGGYIGNYIDLNNIDDKVKIWVNSDKHEITFKTVKKVDDKNIHKITSTKLSADTNIEIKDDCTTKINVHFYDIDKVYLGLRSKLTSAGYGLNINYGEEVYVKPGTFVADRISYDLFKDIPVSFDFEDFIGEDTFNISASKEFSIKSGIPKVFKSGFYKFAPRIYDVEGREEGYSTYAIYETIVKNTNTSRIFNQDTEKLEPGVYDITQIVKDRDGNELTRVETLGVTVVGSTEGYLSSKDKAGNFKILEDKEEMYSTEIIGAVEDYNYYDLRGICDTSKEYTISKMLRTTEGIKDVTGVIRYYEPTKEWYEDIDTIKYNNTILDTSNLRDYSITNSKGVTINNTELLNEDKKLLLIDGQEYKISGILEDKDGYYYVTKVIKATSDVTEIKLEKDLGSKVDIKNNASEMTYVSDVRIKNINGTELTINNLTCGKLLYLPRDKYTIDLKAPIGILGFASYTKEVDAMKSYNEIIVGDKITYNPILSIDENKDFFINFQDVKVDGIELRDTNNVKVSSSTVKKLMHGDRVLLNLDSSNVDKLNGKCSISLEETYKGVGKVTIDRLIVDINNQLTDLVPEDINLDGIVDLFDLVAVSISMGTVPGDTMWDYRVNIVSNDEVIDVIDLSAIASKYNKYNK